MAIRNDNVALGDFGFSFKKLKRAVTSGIKTVTKPLVVPVKIAQDIKNKGLVKGLKAIPSRIHVDAIKAGADFTGDTARLLGAEKLGVKMITNSAKLQTWTQRRPIQTLVGAAAAGGAGYLAFVAAPAAIGGGSAGAAAAGGGTAAAGGGTAAAAGGTAAAGAGISTTTVTTGSGLLASAVAAGKEIAEDQAKKAAEEKARDVLDAVVTGGAPAAEPGTPAITPLAPDGTPITPKSNAAAFGPLAGAGAGFLAAGPLGAAVGGVVGYFLTKKA